MKRRYAAAAGLGGFILAGLMGAHGIEPGIDSVTIAGVDGKLNIVVGEGDRSRIIEVVKEPDGQFLYRFEDGSVIIGKNMKMVFVSREKAREEEAARKRDGVEILTFPFPTPVAPK